MDNPWNPENYQRHAAYVPDLAGSVLELAAPQPDEKVLDLGCGDGVLTKTIADLGCEVVGVDSSPEMVAEATGRGIDARVMDAHQLDFEEEFDLVFSNAVLHWVRFPDRLIAGVHQALKPAGRFVGEFGGQGNIQSIVEALSLVFFKHPEFGSFNNPWFFPSTTTYKGLLEAGGFAVNHIELIDRPTPIEGSITDWLEVFAGGIAGHLNAQQKQILFSEVEDLLREELLGDDGWVIDYVRLRFEATKRNHHRVDINYPNMNRLETSVEDYEQ